MIPSLSEVPAQKLIFKIIFFWNIIYDKKINFFRTTDFPQILVVRYAIPTRRCEYVSYRNSPILYI